MRTCRLPLFSLLAMFVPLTSLQGCVHVHLDAGDFLKPDRSPATAQLADGYVVDDGVVEHGGRLIAYTHAHRDGNRVVILFFGGDSFHRSQAGGTVLTSLAQQADIVLFDYPGYGGSTGTPDVASLLEAGSAMSDYVARLAARNRQKALLYGFSLGGMLAAQVARTGGADALVLEATAPDVRRWIDSQIPWFARPFVRVHLSPELARIDGVAALEGFQGPVLLLAGGKDGQAPPALMREMARRLERAGIEARVVEFAKAGHGEIHASPEFGAQLAEFVRQL